MEMSLRHNEIELQIKNLEIVYKDTRRACTDAYKKYQNVVSAMEYEGCPYQICRIPMAKRTCMHTKCGEAYAEYQKLKNQEHSAYLIFIDAKIRYKAIIKRKRISLCNYAKADQVYADEI